MNYLLGLILIGASFWSLPAHAHYVKTEGPISVLFHIQPNDKPATNQRALIHIYFTDLEKKFNGKNCECTLTIFENGQKLSQKQLFQDTEDLYFSEVPFIFPRKSIYALEVTGAPINGATFQAFKTSYELRVDTETKMINNRFYTYPLYIGGFLFVSFLFYKTINKKQNV